ncbi:hypothetical protein GGR26_002378 [Lewinella marina]|uniref:Uncharacterized protein n=1 Tax=Neolewinella marina TaxID=438751 RepID=A0A2G0CG38_9BACT|nr:hypothetical protein [Neolewinella marina]NJB86610.1 hypothetical protein [Neolewinella marina]PHK98939.1 hypothetical protein CGL56_05620 [Neolewinella marina]
MHPVLQHLIDNDFRDLAGSRVEGQLSLSDDLINLGIHELLAQLTAPAPAPPAPTEVPSPKPQTTTPAPDPRALLGKLDVEKLNYRTETGRTIVEIACAIKN